MTVIIVVKPLQGVIPLMCTREATLVKDPIHAPTAIKHFIQAVILKGIFELIPKNVHTHVNFATELLQIDQALENIE